MTWYNPFSWGGDNAAKAYAAQSAALTAGYRADNPNGTVAKATDEMQQQAGNFSVAKAQPLPGNQMSQPQHGQTNDPFSTEIFRFPPNIGSDDASAKHLHWVKFTPCIQNKSEYNIKTTDELSSADRNRSGGVGAGSANPFDAIDATAVGTGLAVINGIGTAGDTISNVLSADTRNVEKAFWAGVRQGVGDIAGGVVSAGIVSSIELSRKTRRAEAYICLYMPDTVSQQLVNDYDQVSLTQALGKAGMVAAAGHGIGEAMKQSIASGTMTTGLGGAGIGAEIAGAVAEKTGNFGAGINDVLLFSAGLAQNPQVELLFKSIQNREFLFDFRFVPRSKAEAETIIQIIKKFRFHAAPEIPTSGKGRYFIPPSEFDIEFCVGRGRNANLPRISTCVLEGIDVNYGSAGQWTAFADGMPVEISMQLRFKEVEIMHKKLIADGY